MSTVSREDAKRKARGRRAAAGLPMRSAQEKQAAMDRPTAEARAHKLVRVPGSSATRVSAIQHGEPDRAEVAPLGTYVEALGGRLRVVAGSRMRSTPSPETLAASPAQSRRSSRVVP
jgi:hypothetical protein